MEKEDSEATISRLLYEAEQSKQKEERQTTKILELKQAAENKSKETDWSSFAHSVRDLLTEDKGPLLMTDCETLLEQI
jgi:hypothetical protein